jgi:hypothetical protein
MPKLITFIDTYQAVSKLWHTVCIWSLHKEKNCGFQMKNLFVAAFLMVIILVASSVFVHVSTDLMGSDAFIIRDYHSGCWRERRAAGDYFRQRPVKCTFLNKRVGK